MKFKFLTFALVFLASVACGEKTVVNTVPGKEQEEEQTPVEASDKLLVCSFNIRYYNTTDAYPWSARKDAVMKFINTVQPDFIGLQELRSSQSQDFTYSLSSDYALYDINRDTGMSIGGSSGEGVGILYNKDRFRIEDKGFFWLAENPDMLPDKNSDGTYSSWHSACRRVVVWVKAADLAHSEKTVYFFATHFDHVSSDARLNSSELTLSKLKEITGIAELLKSDTPVYLVADFNCEYGSSELTPLKSALNYARTTAAQTDNGRTFNSFGESANSIIDHIFYVGNVTADSYRVVTEDYGVKYISDHYPILLECTYK